MSRDNRLVGGLARGEVDVPSTVHEEFPSPSDVEAAAKRLSVDPAQYAAHVMLLSSADARRELARVLESASRDQGDRDLVYGEHAGGLVFIPEPRARQLAAVVDAWWNSSTRGEFRTRIESYGLADEMLAYFGYLDDYPSDDEPLTDEQKNSYTQDGDWPPWAAAEMLDWVPKEIALLGESGISMTSGPALFFELDQIAELVAAFEEHGFACRRDDVLVQAAHAVS